MPIACLIIARPLDRATGSRVPIYMSSANDRRVTGLNNVLWEPAIKAPPPLTINLWNGDFQAAPDPGNATFTVNMGVVKRSFPAADSYAWMGAPVEIYAAEIGTAWPWTQRVLGRVSSYNRRGQSLTLTAKVETEKFAKNVLTATYAGSGGVEGGADLKNRVKPLVIGWAKNVEPVLIDAVNSVYQVSGYGAIEGVTTLYERASDFGASIGDFGTYAALVAASIPAGRWATCLAAGLVRLGAPAYGVITVDVRGHKVGSTTPRLTGAVISTLATIAGVSGSDLHSASLAALDSAVPYPINLVLTDQTTFIDIAQRLALGCNWQSAISLVGTFFVSAINLASSPAVTLNAQGRASPQVINLPDELEVSVPYWKVTMGANRSWRVQTPDEIATAAALVERGTYSGTETYREGNIVELGDGSRYQYIATTPAAGISPPNATYWTMLSASPVVAGIAGQAWAATNGSQAAVDNNYVSGFANQAIDSEFTLGNRSWDEGWASSGTWVWDYFTALTSKRFLARYCVSPAAGAQISMGQNTFCGLPVIDGDRLELSAIVSWSNMSVANLFVGFFSAAGAYIGGQVIASGIMDTRVGGFVTVPAGYGIGIAKLMATFTVATGGTIANGRIAQPFIRRCSAGQTALSPYQPGTPIERGADVTGSNTAAAIAGQAATATNSDYGAVTGAKPPSDADKTGTNIAAGISGQAATATNSDYGAVTGTKPPSNATNGAPSGTPVGSISANDVAATINPGGGVATNKVSTPAMVLNAVNMPYASTLGYSVTLPRYVETNIFPSPLAPTASADDTMIRVTVLLSLACDNDIQGYYRVYHTPPGGSETLIYDKFLQIYSDAFAPSSQTLSFVHRITSPAAGTHLFRVAFYRTSDASIFYADAGSDQEAIVIRR